MASIKKSLVVGLALLLVVVALSAFTQKASAASIAPAQPTAFGPRIDEIIWSEEGDRSKALTEIIAGTKDTIMFDITNPADKERALASDQVATFPAFGFFDELTLNPAVQSTGPDNPFAIREVREAMQYMIDRDFVVREIYSGFAMPFKTTFHPRSPDYGRGISDFLKLEDKYAYNPDTGRTQMFNALQAANYAIGTDGYWHDPSGELIVIKGLRRIQDERLLLGTYYGNVLRGLSFNVQDIGVSNAGIPYGSPPDQNIWHYYTAGWIATSLTAWDDGQIQFFATCGIGEPFCTRGGAFYSPPQELIDISDKLLFGQYTSLTERAQLIADGTDLAMAEAVRIFIDARQSLFVTNNRLTGVVWDLFGGPTNPWSIKAASVPADPDTVQRARIMNLLMFVDGWNPYVSPGWLYDGVQRDAMIDPGMNPHPHTGRWIDYRNRATVETAGPTGTLSIPADAVVFNTTTSTWVPVGAGRTAVSKVSLDHVFGQWHHGMDITMDDVLYDWSSLYRRAQGDQANVPGVDNAATPTAETFVATTLQAIRAVDSDTLEVYMNYWHADLQEIAGFASSFPSAPWEVQELAAQLLLDEVAVYNDGDIAGTGRIWLDLTKGDSMPFLATALSNLTAANHIPPGMSSEITTAEATARWAALNAWATAHGNYWPSNGPFYLDTVDIGNRQTIMKAFTTGYPFDETYWDALTTVAIPEVSFTPTPPVVFAGTPAVFDYFVNVGPQPTDNVTAVWFLRDVSTGEFLSQGVPTRLGTGSYRIQIPGTQTEQLLLGNFEVISVVTGLQAAVPTITRSAFLILPSTAWFEALLDARAGLIEDEVADLSGDLGQVQTDLSGLSGATSGLLGLVTAMAILAVIAVVVSVVSVVLVLRRGRAPPMKTSEGGDMGEI
jgi:peptide/nickel transport system substrate-binding protein